MILVEWVVINQANMSCGWLRLDVTLNFWQSNRVVDVVDVDGETCVVVCVDVVRCRVPLSKRKMKEE
jgi:hypothetical protein